MITQTINQMTVKYGQGSIKVKKKFDDRKDKDIDNDGDVDSSDKYLHKRRQAISKAVKKEWVEADGSARRVAEGDKRKDKTMKEKVSNGIRKNGSNSITGTAIGSKIGDKITSSKKMKGMKKKNLLLIFNKRKIFL